MKIGFLRTSTPLYLLFLCGCSVGQGDFKNSRNEEVGTVVAFKKPFRFEDAGEFYRADFVITGQGFTHITKDDDGNFIYHFSSQEVLSNAPRKEWVGKCLYYYVVDSTTYVIKGWGFDEGGNPLSCRSWM
jgi:hypothetical protein